MLPMWASSVSTTSRVPDSTRIAGGWFGSKKRWHCSRRSLGVTAVSVSDIALLSRLRRHQRPRDAGAAEDVGRARPGGVHGLDVAVPAHRVRDLDRTVADGGPGDLGPVVLADRREAHRRDQPAGVVPDRRADAADAEHGL